MALTHHLVKSSLQIRAIISTKEVVLIDIVLVVEKKVEVGGNIQSRCR